MPLRREPLARSRCGIAHEQLAAVDDLRLGTHLRGCAQKNPQQEVEREAFEPFSQLANVTCTRPEEDGSVSQEADPATRAPAVPELGRKDPCRCGGGKKYKQCHRRLA